MMNDEEMHGLGLGLGLRGGCCQTTEPKTYVWSWERRCMAPSPSRT